MYMLETKEKLIYMLYKKLKAQGLEQLTLLEAGTYVRPLGGCLKCPWIRREGAKLAYLLLDLKEKKNEIFFLLDSKSSKM